MIFPYGLQEPSERKGAFNGGMPHNTFLFVADRMGMVGLTLILFCWSLIFGRLLATFRRTRRADDLVGANILAAMFGFATFVLFFERPVTNAAFWIVMAAGARMIEYQAVASVRTETNVQPALRVYHA
jgi:O-antigen ligase